MFTFLVQHYEISVYTGDHWAAGTDANVYITMYGSKGDSGKRWLYHSDTNPEKFQRNKVRISFKYIPSIYTEHTFVMFLAGCPEMNMSKFETTKLSPGTDINHYRLTNLSWRQLPWRTWSM